MQEPSSQSILCNPAEWNGLCRRSLVMVSSLIHICAPLTRPAVTLKADFVESVEGDVLCACGAVYVSMCIVCKVFILVCVFVLLCRKLNL